MPLAAVALPAQCLAECRLSRMFHSPLVVNTAIQNISRDTIPTPIALLQARMGSLTFTVRLPPHLWPSLLCIMVLLPMPLMQELAHISLLHTARRSQLRHAVPLPLPHLLEVLCLVSH
jgi:hypothetical protein